MNKTICLLTTICIAQLFSTDACVDNYKSEIASIKKKLNEMEQLINQYVVKNGEEKKLVAHDKSINEMGNVLALLVKYGSNPDGMSPLFSAIKAGDESTVSTFLFYGASVNSKDGEYTALSWAARSNQYNIALILLNMGASVNLTGGGKGRTPIQYAAEFGSGALVTLLIERQADLYISNIYDSGNGNASALHTAAINGNYDAVVALVKGNALVNGKPSKVSANNWPDGTPLDWAAYNLKYKDNPKNLELVKFLVEFGGTRKYMGTVPCPVIRGFLESVGR
jgi:ankyrin repeat protein